MFAAIKREHALSILLLLLLLLHLATVLSAQHIKTGGKPAASILASDIALKRQLTDLNQAANAFSVSFGVTPKQPQLNAAEAVAEKKQNTFIALKPQLVAVDASSGQLTARLLLDSNERKKLISVQPGDSVHQYKLSQLSMTEAVFIPEQSDESSSPVILTLFKSDAQ